MEINPYLLNATRKCTKIDIFHLGSENNTSLYRKVIFLRRDKTGTENGWQEISLKSIYE